ncbi:UDP-N-acetylmuramoyl-tripeptide--D-alanyl-D-alanine ligase [Nocardia sp.]|uniref:UDP-N-acetylmuramoyl-tripeptide--D-alanyl-D- alanine ligase n=1 Tax=Nocardia sp. TaxID=1821 RepID=UPI00262CE5A6|nr:UDP-N-acetylmuramoyl-tripeptide--D-alanyl-D-alanine ligase [Nocardia sp.]
MTLADVALATGGQLSGGADPAQIVTAPTAFDSRTVEAGGLFACLAGARADGHDYADQAIEAGVVAVLATRPTGVPAVLVDNVIVALGDLARAVATRYTGTVLAITGSAGKTSTKDLLVQILEEDRSVVATARSFNNELGFPTTVLRVRTDTDILVLEMGARGKGHISHLAQIARPSVGAVLGVGTAHLGEFGTKQAIADAKRELVEALDASGTAVLNGDDPFVRAMAESTAASILWFGTTEDADVRASAVTLDEHARARFILSYENYSAPVHLRVVGEHHLTNALAAAALALSVGVPFSVVVDGLKAARLLSGSRMEVTDRADGVTVINDAFNASPESVSAALRSLVVLAAADRPSIAVLGEMRELGDTAAEVHAEIGRQVATLGIGQLITVGGPNAVVMAEAARASNSAALLHVAHVAKKDHLLPVLARTMCGRDVVLFKGANSAALFETAATLASI